MAFGIGYVVTLYIISMAKECFRTILSVGISGFMAKTHLVLCKIS